MFGVEARPAFALGLLLSQGGEFGFVLFAQARGALLIAPQAASLFGAVVTLSMATTPLLMLLARRFNAKGSGPERDDLERPSAAAPAAAIVVGYGRFGQTVAQMLMAKSITVTLIDNRAEQIDRSQSFGAKVYYGDGTRLDLLRLAGAEEARAILFCNDGDALEPATLTPVLEAFPHAAVMVRVYDRRQLIRLQGVDLAGTVREVYESAICMGRQALAAVGIEAAEVDRVEEEYRRRDALRLTEQGLKGDLHAAQHMVFTPERSLDTEERVL
jgi:glutathione-regulated potassium-efflux system protein KefB